MFQVSMLIFLVAYGYYREALTAFIGVASRETGVQHTWGKVVYRLQRRIPALPTSAQRLAMRQEPL